MGKNNVYTAQYAVTLPAGNAFTSNFSIVSVGREISIKSIAVDWMIEDAMGVIYPYRTNINQRFNLIIGNFGLNPQQFGKAFNPTGGTPAQFNGNTFIITEPKQLQFNSFFVVNELPFSLQVLNNSAAERIHNIAIMVETTEQTMFL